LTTILGNSTYQWQRGTLYQLNDVNPKVIFPQAGDYDITLTATTIHGCKDVVNKLIQVKNDYGVYVPSSFSPNYDGLNDNFIPVFSPYGLDLKTYSLEVYDRWGEQLFSTKDFTVGWNGTVKNRGDEPLKEDVYVYKIRFKDIDGKIHNKTGHVTLMK
jgi:gliding motility-associated-like protein